MSTCVVVKKGGYVTIAADSQTSFGSTKAAASYLGGAGKIIKVRDSYLGITGWSAHSNVLFDLAADRKPAIDFSSPEAIFKTLLGLQSSFREKYFMRSDDSHDGDQPYDSMQMSFLIVNRHGAFSVGSWREVYAHELFWATGSGRSFALGAMHALYHQPLSSRQIARRGVEAGCEFDDGSGPPVVQKTIKLLA